MAFNVHLHVAFACDDHGAVARLAERYLPVVRALAEDARPGEQRPPTERVRRYYGVLDAARYLDALARRDGPAAGWKGRLSVWGEIRNHTDPLAFAAALRPFWRDLLLAAVRPPERGGFRDGPLQFERVIVLYEEEGAEHAGAIEIGLLDPEAAADTEEGDVFVRHHERLPFTWMQC